MGAHCAFCTMGVVRVLERNRALGSLRKKRTVCLSGVSIFLMNSQLDMKRGTRKVLITWPVKATSCEVNSDPSDHLEGLSLMV